MTDINLDGYDNEDNDYPFVLKIGTVDSSTPYDITSVDFEADIRDSLDVLVLRMTTYEIDGRIQKTDPANGKFKFHIALGEIAFVAKRSLKYDLIMHVSGVATRLWGGKLKIHQGTTDTVEP